MIRIAFTEESKEGSEYQVLLSSESDTVDDLLRKRHVDTKTKNVFINGKRITPEGYSKPIKSFIKTETIVFITVKYKTFDKPRRASDK